MVAQQRGKRLIPCFLVGLARRSAILSGIRVRGVETAVCGSFGALGDSTARGSVLLAKSADTEVNEAEHVVRFEARDYPDGALVRITHLNTE